MSLPAQSVVVSHPGKQHAYQVVLALQRAGLLLQFITGIYYKPSQFPYTLVRWLPPPVRDRALRELKKRRVGELDDGLITCAPYLEVPSRTIGGMPPLVQLTEGRSSYLLANWASDLYVSHWITQCRKTPTVLYSFLGSALQSFRQAKRMGLLTVLDVPTMLRGPRIVAEEKRRLGLQTSYVEIERRLQQEVRIADYVITPSRAAADSVIDFGISSSKVCILPFGVDLHQFRPRSVETAIPGRAFRALFVGKFALHKGIHHMFEAWRQLALPESELMIVGPAGDQEFVEEMRAKYRGSFIEYGNIPHYDIHDLFSRADIFVFPSLAEGSALVTYEALASGLPCVVTHEAGSVVRDGVEGFVVPAGNVETLRNRILRLYQDEGLRRDMAAAARRRAEEFSWHNYGRRLVNRLDEIMGGH